MEQLNKYVSKYGLTLPSNWTIKSVKRKDGASRGQVDHYYFTPEGTRFRSKVEVLKYLRHSEPRENVETIDDTHDRGFIYILTNTCFKEKFIKIGMCTSIDSRLGILNSGVYEKFKMHTLFNTQFKNKKNGKKTVCSYITKKIEMYLHARFNHLRANNGEFFLVDPDIVRGELKYIHDKVLPYANLDAGMVGEYMRLHIQSASISSREEEEYYLS